MKSILRASILLLFLFQNSCTSIPKGAEVVHGFEKDKYLGQWFEIARLNHSFEKNLDQVTATYGLTDEGEISVWNKGFNTKTKEFKEILGHAKFAQNDSIGQLKVSFFGPFYATYNIVSIDIDYQYALVAGNNLNYLWFLAREPKMSADIKAKYLSMAYEIGYDTNQLIWVNQEATAQ